MSRIVGIMSAMQEEIYGVEALMEDVKEHRIGSRVYYSGKIHQHQVVLVFSGWGKVAAASTVTTLIHRFGVNEILFTGVAGAVLPSLRIGDIVLAKRLVQHDMDARPVFQQYEIPLLNRDFIAANEMMLDSASGKIKKMLSSGALEKQVGLEVLAKFEINEPELYIGDIASGDQFISQISQRDKILSGLPTVVCVEMEGAAVAQVCLENQLAFTIIRTISDAADENSHIDFLSFVNEVSRNYSIEVVKHILGE